MKAVADIGGDIANAFTFAQEMDGQVQHMGTAWAVAARASFLPAFDVAARIDRPMKIDQYGDAQRRILHLAKVTVSSGADVASGYRGS